LAVIFGTATTGLVPGCEVLVLAVPGEVFGLST
jgi:hypothetical protein